MRLALAALVAMAGTACSDGTGGPDGTDGGGDRRDTTRPGPVRPDTRGADGLPVTVAATSELGAGPPTTWAGQPRTLAIGSRDGVDLPLVTALRRLAGDSGARIAVLHQATVELTDPSALADPTGPDPTGPDPNLPDWVVPLSVVGVPGDAAPELLGPEAAAVLDRGDAVIGRTSAQVRGVGPGGELAVIAWNDPRRVERLRVGAVVEDRRAPWGELIVSLGTAQRIGLDRPWRVAVWAGDLERVAEGAAALVGDKEVRRSWAPVSVDEVLSTAVLKAGLGELRIRRSARGRRDDDVIETDPAWLADHIVRVELPLIGPVTCHRVLIEPLRAALSEIEQAGLGPLIDVPDTRRAGGCHNSRLIRSATGTAGRNLSRHAWGAALDLNPSTNRYGALPTMDARIVDTFRRHGFAWGGTFPIPDGMHFEWIGRPRMSGAPLPTTTSTTTSTTPSTSTTTSTTPSTSTTTSPSTSTSSTVPSTSTSSTVPSTTSPSTSPSTTSPSTTGTTATTAAAVPATAAPQDSSTTALATTSSLEVPTSMR